MPRPKKPRPDGGGSPTKATALVGGGAVSFLIGLLGVVPPVPAIGLAVTMLVTGVIIW
jgi:hypothetical protein